MKLTREELDLIRQWYNALVDTNREYLERADSDLAERIYLELGMRMSEHDKIRPSPVLSGLLHHPGNRGETPQTAP